MSPYRARLPLCASGFNKSIDKFGVNGATPWTAGLCQVVQDVAVTCCFHFSFRLKRNVIICAKRAVLCRAGSISVDPAALTKVAPANVGLAWHL